MGLFVAEKMRAALYVTMLDPLQHKLGRRMGVLMFLPAAFGDVLWSASILSALGGTLSVILDIDVNASVIASSCVATLYTLLGGLYAVAYTDVIQLLCMIGGLWLCIPFVLSNPAVTEITQTGHFIGNQTGWIGQWDPKLGWQWFDFMIALILGAVPWQEYYQRILACDTPRTAKVLSLFSAGAITIMTIPSVIIGAVAASTDWNRTEYGLPDPAARNQSSFILPLAMRYLTPKPVAFIGLAAASCAIMSSTDSIILSSASMFSRNVYKMVIRPQASDRELVWAVRAGIVVVGTLACVLALTAKSVYGMFVLSIDIAYVTLSPQLLCVLYLDINTYGSLPAVILGFLLRLGGGEPSFNMKPFIAYPGGHSFPFRTFAMLVSLTTLISISYIAKFLFEKKYVPAKYDLLNCRLAYGGRTRFPDNWRDVREEKNKVEMQRIRGEQK